VGRPFSHGLVSRGDHYAFRCVVKDGGRPWVPLPPGLTLAEAQDMAMEIKKLAASGHYTWDGRAKSKAREVASQPLQGTPMSDVDLRPIDGTSVVYAIRSLASGLIKIGTSRQVHKRLQRISTSCGSALSVLAVIEADRTVEAEWHAAFSGIRQPGEWFKPSAHLFDEIRKRLMPLSLITTTPTRGPGRGSES